MDEDGCVTVISWYTFWLSTRRTRMVTERDDPEVFADFVRKVSASPSGSPAWAV